MIASCTVEIGKRILFYDFCALSNAGNGPGLVTGWTAIKNWPFFECQKRVLVQVWLQHGVSDVKQEVSYRLFLRNSDVGGD